jgi:hypothetical protein
MFASLRFHNFRTFKPEFALRKPILRFLQSFGTVNYLRFERPTPEKRQPLCLSASETEGRRYDMTMNLGKAKSQRLIINAGLDDELPSSRRGSVFLDIPFYRTGLPSTGIG